MSLHVFVIAFPTHTIRIHVGAGSACPNTHALHTLSPVQQGYAYTVEGVSKQGYLKLSSFRKEEYPKGEVVGENIKC